ncbi:MAG: hypothetical protein ABI689_09665 [Thermoanaerobaculia bacterium]
MPQAASTAVALAAGLVLTLVTAVSAGAAPASAPSGTPTQVVITGSLQSELGCAGDWNPACAATGLSYDANDGVWQATFIVPVGTFAYIAAIDGSFAETYGLHGEPGGANIPLTLAAPAPVKFYYSDTSHWVTDSVNTRIASVPGSFQSEIGCSSDWQPDCLRSWLQDVDGDGIARLTLRNLPAGAYDGMVTIAESWSESYGLGGVPGGANIPVTVPYSDYQSDFSYDDTTHILTIVFSLFSDGFEGRGTGEWSLAVP